MQAKSEPQVLQMAQIRGTGRGRRNHRMHGSYRGEPAAIRNILAVFGGASDFTS